MTETLQTTCYDAVFRHIFWGDTPSPNKKKINSFLKENVDVYYWTNVMVTYVGG
jgi:hypothetical protein